MPGGDKDGNLSLYSHVLSLNHLDPTQPNPAQLNSTQLDAQANRYRFKFDKARRVTMPRPSEECPIPSANNSQTISSDFLDDVNGRLIEWLKQEATNSEYESSEEDTSSDEEGPENKSHGFFGRMAHRLKKWFTHHYHHED
ncbi:hypothetical protein FOVG_06966 [Fusarium oxysporum f. sp. pisi HDV247]|uniref:Uncharacterized protein n=1 Tax=Fusarium oxysporum f. sp. pisi HDV247 TaxID=1080344 RepID=W9PT81_FUSOX|nr:hypothetical protein FOVG_06966 [Fusarium oxysporum f. sp. pisi HDV247]